MVATEMPRWRTTPLTTLLAALICSAGIAPSHAAVLPEDRADVMYHRYEGGGITIQGPSLLVRKTMAEKYAVSANYYQDLITSASIDVEVSGASQYKEQRDQYSLGFEWLAGKAIYTLGFTTSKENDYDAQTFSFGLSQDMFGDLTTLSMGFSRGTDTVRNSTDPDFSRDVDRYSYRLGLSQILTRSLLTTLNLEVITDEGFLNNPYRSYRHRNADDPRLFTLAREIYPRTRTSNALALNARYFLPYRAALYGGYRIFNDTWDIRANTFELGYVHPLQRTWTLEARLRYYQQDLASFYADLFDRPNQQNFLARDKELSTFDSVALRLGATYEFISNGSGWAKRGSFSLFYDRLQFDYQDFRDARVSMLPVNDPGFRPAGSEPLYSFGANVIQAFLSVWF